VLARLSGVKYFYTQLKDDKSLIVDSLLTIPSYQRVHIPIFLT